MSEAGQVLRFAESMQSSVSQLLARYGLSIRLQANDRAITASFWGDEEAGLKGDTLYLRNDTPLHSVLHEACHYVCMNSERRAGLHTDAGGDYDEENAVCYLQILLADEIKGFSKERMMLDMDSWGYTFRLGSARAWFEQDAADALAWLKKFDLVGSAGQPTYRLR